MANSPSEEARGISSTALDTSSNGLREYIEQTAAQWFQPTTVTIFQLQDHIDPKKAFYIIRDNVLLAKIPVVFFKDFDIDSSGGDKLSWLKYFLAPMRDEKFFDKECDRHIGPAVFAFV